MKPRLAKRLVEPTWLQHPVWVETYGPEVCEIATLAGMPPYPEQELVHDMLFAIGPDGKSVSFETDVIAARQVLKTGSILQAELGWLYVTDQKLIVHSAHELSTTEEAFIDLANMIERTPALSSMLAPSRGERPGITEGNGQWAIELAKSEACPDGQRVKYKARTKSGGRGLTGWKVVLDEGFALLPSHMGALLPTLTSVPDPQVLIASSAGLMASSVLRDARNRGRAGSDPTQAYVEWGDIDAWKGCLLGDECTHAKNVTGCALDDVDRWFKIIPGLGSRIPVSRVQSFRRSMPPEEFLREFMVWWDDPPTEGDAPPPIDLDQWAALTRKSAKAPTTAFVVLDVSPDRRTSSIGIAGEGPADTTLVLEHTAGGTSWVVPRLQQILEKRQVLDVALHPGGQAAVLIPELTKAGIEFETLTQAQQSAACAAFQEAVGQAQISHVGQDDLDTAVANATVVNRGEGQMWNRKDRRVNISPLVACSNAAYRWMTRKPTRRPMASFI